MSLPSLSPAELAENRAPVIWGGAITAFALATIAIPLRVISRRITGTKFWWDDYFIFIAYPFACGVFAAGTYWITCGAGQHLAVVLPKDPTVTVKILKSIIAAEITYTLGICFAKFSILCFYWRIFGHTSGLRKVLIGLFVFVLCWTISTCVVGVTLCIPLRALWDTSVSGKCVDLSKFLFAVAIPNVVTDWFMLALPLGYVWRLQMSFRQKLSVTGFFAVGGFVCIVSLVRAITIAHMDLTDFTWGIANLDVWTCVESMIAVFCACLPSLKPIYNFIVLGKGSSHNTSDVIPSADTNGKAKSGNSNGNKGSKASKGLWSLGAMNSSRGDQDSFSRLHDEDQNSARAVYVGHKQQNDDSSRPIDIELASVER